MPECPGEVKDHGALIYLTAEVQTHLRQTTGLVQDWDYWGEVVKTKK